METETVENSNQIRFRVDAATLTEIQRYADFLGVSPSLAAKRVMIQAMRQQSEERKHAQEGERGQRE